MASKKNAGDKPPATVFESLMFVAVAATVMGIAFLVLALSRYEWALPQ